MEFPPPFADTDPKALEVWLELHRRMTVGEKLEAVFRATRLVLAAQEAGVRLRYPAADEREVFLRAAAMRLPRETMVKAYGWDPDEH